MKAECGRSWELKAFRILFLAVLKDLRLCVHACVCEGPSPKPVGMSGKIFFVDYCWLELNVADTFKPEPLLCHLETQTFNLVSNGCENLFSMQMLVNYSTEWLLGQFCGAILIRVACFGEFPTLFTCIVSLDAKLTIYLLSIVPGNLLTLVKKEAKELQKIISFSLQWCVVKSNKNGC